MKRAFRNDVFQWDVATWSPAERLWSRYLPPAGKALAVGERGGGLSLWLASKGFQVVCSDLRDLPDETTELHKRYGVEERISYEKQDAMALSYPDESFDVVMFKSVIGALSTKENQRQAVDEFHRVLRPGGVLLFAENLEGTKLHKAMRKRFVKWDSYWRYLKYHKDLDLFRDFSQVEYSYHGCAAAFGRSETMRRTLSAIDSGFEFVVPRSWRYVLAGACVK